MNEEQLQESTDTLEGIERPDFIRTKSKLYKKRLAPQGWLFFKVELKTKGMIYSNVMQINCNGLTEEQETAVWQSMEQSITKKYQS